MGKTSDDRLVYSIPEAAHALHCSKSLVYDLVKADKLPHVHLSKKRVVIVMGSKRDGTDSSSIMGVKMPAALLPPPTQATITSGRRPSAWSICWRASRPIQVWKVRTMVG